MGQEEQAFVVLLLVVNLAAGLGGAALIARMLGQITARPKRVLRYSGVLVGIYFLECVAFSAGMCTQVFSVGLAFVWGTIFGLWLRGLAPASQILKAAFFVSVYTSLPTASFCILVPLGWLVGGGHILSTPEGVGFGIPDFLPWPFGTILGFFSAVMVVTIVLKTTITTGEVGLLVRRMHKC
jgi:hypothetical protein